MNQKTMTNIWKNDPQKLLKTAKDTCYNEAVISKEENEYEEFWQNLTIQDDFMFGKIMGNRELCIQLLRLIFPHQAIERIEYVKVQESIRMDKESKGIRLDVFVKDNKNTAFCVEMQTRNEDNLPKRSRYYQSLIDLELLDRGQHYDSLSPSYVVFICSKDLFHLGYHVYEFKNYCMQDRETELGDEATKIFLNAQGKGGDISPELKEFLDYVAGKENEKPSPFIGQLKRAVYHAKQNREWRRERMIMYFREMDIRMEAEREARNKLIMSMLDNGLEREVVKKVAEIGDEELDSIIKSREKTK